MKTNTIIAKDGKVYRLIADYDFADDICEEVEKEFTEHLLIMGYSKGAKDMEKAKQIIIDSLLKEIEQIRVDVINKFAHALKETFNNEFPSNYHCTQPYFTLDNVRVLVDCVAKEQKDDNTN